MGPSQVGPLLDEILATCLVKNDAVETQSLCQMSSGYCFPRIWVSFAFGSRWAAKHVGFEVTINKQLWVIGSTVSLLPVPERERDAVY